jgi:hypothetical protein
MASSTTQAEYVALSDAARELLAHLSFFESLPINIPPPILHNENEAAESIAKRNPDYQRSDTSLSDTISYEIIMRKEPIESRTDPGRKIG